MFSKHQHLARSSAILSYSFCLLSVFMMSCINNSGLPDTDPNEPGRGGPQTTCSSDSCSDLIWVTIPAGQFEMGIEDGLPNTIPVRVVTLSSFQVTQTEVTVGQYRKCVDEGVCVAPVDCSTEGLTWHEDPRGEENLPISCLTWDDARTFAQWAGGDLLSEAEWEYTARGGAQGIFAGSDHLDEVSWTLDNTQTVQPVGLKQANPFGVYDMSGNLFEWVLDEYRLNYDNAPINGEPVCSLSNCDHSPERFPRVKRGGWWGGGEATNNVYHRGNVPEARGAAMGMRVRRPSP